MNSFPHVKEGTLPSASFLAKCKPEDIMGYGPTTRISRKKYYNKSGQLLWSQCKNLCLKAKSKRPTARYIVVLNMFDNDSRLGSQPYFARMNQSAKGKHWHMLKHRAGEPVGFHNWYYLVPALRKYGQHSFRAISQGHHKPIKDMTDDEVRKWVVFKPRTNVRCKLVAYARTDKILRKH